MFILNKLLLRITVYDHCEILNFLVVFAHIMDDAHSIFSIMLGYIKIEIIIKICYEISNLVFDFFLIFMQIDSNEKLQNFEQNTFSSVD